MDYSINLISGLLQSQVTFIVLPQTIVNRKIFMWKFIHVVNIHVDLFSWVLDYGTHKNILT